MRPTLSADLKYTKNWGYCLIEFFYFFCYNIIRKRFMKYIITNENIELKYFLFKIIFPHSSTFKCVLIDERKRIGVNAKGWVGIILYSKERRYKPWFGFILHFLYNMPNDTLSAHIYGLQNIEKFLIEAKEKGFDVDDALCELSQSKKIKITFFGK